MAHFEFQVKVEWKGDTELSANLLKDLQNDKYAGVELRGDEQALFFEGDWDNQSFNPLKPLEPIVRDYKDLDFYILSYITEFRPEDADGSSVALIRKGFIVFYEENLVPLDEQDRENFSDDQWIEEGYPDGWKEYAAEETEDSEPVGNVACSFFQNYLPPNNATIEEVLKAVKKNGYALENVPEELKTAEVCLEAVKQNGGALAYVPQELRTAELCLVAVKQDSYALEKVPEELKTAEVCLEAVKEAGFMLEKVPEKLKTAELCLVAVKQDGSDAIKYVPDALKEQVKQMSNEEGGRRNEK
jgi:hypothetical protein